MKSPELHYGEIYDSYGNLVGFGILGLPWSRYPKKEQKGKKKCKSS